jgi:lipid-binding SYLF domain-containing protein
VEDSDVPDELVADLARDFQRQGETIPESLLERGRGIFLVTTMLEDILVGRAEDGGMRLEGRLNESRF